VERKPKVLLTLPHYSLIHHRQQQQQASKLVVSPTAGAAPKRQDDKPWNLDRWGGSEKEPPESKWQGDIKESAGPAKWKEDERERPLMQRDPSGR
jgi:hypothetical protein